MPNRKRGVIRVKVVNARPNPSPPVLHLKRHKQEQAQCPTAPRRTLSHREELGPKPRRPAQAASGGAPADAILKAKMAARRKPAPRS